MATRSEPRRTAGRALVLGAVAGGLARGPSLAGRTPADERLIVGGAVLMGAVAGALVEELAVQVGRSLPGGRIAASAALALAGFGGRAWSSDRRRRPLVDGIETASTVALAGGGAEVAARAVDRAPPVLRLLPLAWVGTLVARGTAELVALQRRLGEPQDLVKASVGYDYLPTVSIGEGSAVALESLDREGRKFLGLATPTARIAEVTRTGALDPIRVYVGLESAGDPAARAGLAVAELDRLGAFDRSRIVVACTTGAGFVHPVPVEAEEYYCAGDVATVAIQYGNRRSYRSLKAVPAGILTYRLLLEAILARARRPELVLYGESLGAWIGAGALAELGGRDLAKVLLVGPPDGAAELVEELRRGLPSDRLTVVVHPEDPVANYSGPTLLWRRPPWLPAGRPPDPRVPHGMRWLPGITFLQVLFDVKNGTAFPVELGATGHDYRRELPTIVRTAFGHSDTPAELLRSVEERVQASARAQAERERAGKSAPRNA
jgi:Alpha/beta-hydrolase family